MASGIQVADTCITTFQQLKLGRKFKYILFTLSDDLSEIIVEKTSDASDYDAFVDALPKDQCRWAAYDFELERDGARRNKLCLVSWSVPSLIASDNQGGAERPRAAGLRVARATSPLTRGYLIRSPDEAKVKDKMLLASSHEALKKRLDGIAFEVQATDRSEISYAAVLAKALVSTH